MSRQFNWLQGYASYVSESESPDVFHLWTGLSVLASAVMRNVWLDQGIYTLYPNMYVVLVGPPGKVAKSTTIRLGRRLLLGLDPKDIVIASDSMTKEDLVATMARIGGKDGTRASAMTIHSTELSSLIDPSGIAMTQFLTDIYDSDDKWRYSTKNSGKFVIHRPVLNILAGTTPRYLSDGLPIEVIGSGFNARIVYVYGDEPRFANPFPKAVDTTLRDNLIYHLDQITHINGPFDYTPEARQKYTTFYSRILKSPPSDYRLEDFHWRKKIHLLKVAMLLSIAERDDRLITEEDLDTGWELLQILEIDMPKTFSAVGKYEYASDLERIVGQIIAAGAKGLTAREIYNRNRAVGDAEIIGKMLILAEKGGSIIRYKNGEGLTVFRSGVENLSPPEDSESSDEA